MSSRITLKLQDLTTFKTALFVCFTWPIILNGKIRNPKGTKQVYIETLKTGLSFHTDVTWRANKKPERGVSFHTRQLFPMRGLRFRGGGAVLRPEPRNRGASTPAICFSVSLSLGVAHLRFVVPRSILLALGQLGWWELLGVRRRAVLSLARDDSVMKSRYLAMWWAFESQACWGSGGWNKGF